MFTKRIPRRISSYYVFSKPHELLTNTGRESIIPRRAILAITNIPIGDELRMGDSLGPT